MRHVLFALTCLAAACGDDVGPPIFPDGGRTDGAPRDSGSRDGGPDARPSDGCVMGRMCTPADPCAEGRWNCAGTPVCEPTGTTAAADTICAGGTCDGLGMCVRTQSSITTPSDGDRFDAFGGAVAVDGTRAVVGAGRAGAGVFADAAYVIERQSDGTWDEVAILDSGDATGGQFGVSVDISGTRILVGSPNTSHSGEASAGAAYVFERQSDGTWSEVARLQAATPATLVRFGRAVALDGDRAVVGAFSGGYPPAMLPGDTGAIYVFERQAAGTWTEVARRVAADAAEADGLGSAVDIEGDVVIAGAPGDRTAAGEDAGSVYVFERGTGMWLETDRLDAMGAEPMDAFGASVTLSGDRLAVGAPLADEGSADDVGVVHVFERGSAGFAQAARLVIAAHRTGDALGVAAIDGDLLVAGAPGFDRVGRMEAGQIFVFERGSSGAWTEVDTLYASAPALSDRFGASVALSGTVALVGAPGREGATDDVGAVYVFDPVR